MNIKAQILKDTFEQSFEMARFERFAKEFFNRLEIVAPNTKITNYMREFSYTIAGHYHVANYSDSQDKRIAILAIELNVGRNIERARSTQRNFVSKLISNSGHDAAIVAFYTENEPKWRLSLVRLDQEWIGGGKVKTTITPAKRFSYLVGEKEPCHTAQEQLFPIFRNEDYNPTLDKIEEAFSVETVTDEFFEAYKSKYHDLREHLESNQNFKQEALKHQFSSEQFAKKMMGQLAFLYFLQKKGWLGVKVVPQNITEKQYKNAYYKSNASRAIIGKMYEQKNSDVYRLKTSLLSSEGFTDEDADILASCFTPEPWGSGTKSFIRDLFDHCKKQPDKNFFDDYLEPLFYEALRLNRGESQYYKRFNCKIPFLNGGLFDPLENYDWKHISFDVPNSMFSNRDEKGERNCDGILDVFERYNFTMNEDEPLEREVAVDPEMLGKIFENLLDVTDRKSKGAYYTPREIVHYMCQESLINYLVNEIAVPYEDVKKFILYGEIMKDEDCSKTIDICDDSQRQMPKSIFVNLRKIDKALENVKVADPAVGSGAFPLGMISEIVRARNNITDYHAIQIINENKKLQSAQRAQYREGRSPYIMKWNTIKNSIYAVDIEASAVDIAKLRLWLSLVVEEDLEPTFDEKVFGISRQKDPNPLPNLDYNIMCGNSLIDEFEGIKLFDESVLENDTSTNSFENNFQFSIFQDQITTLTEHLFAQQDRLFGENNSENKTAIKKSIDKAIDDIIRAKLSRDGNIAGLSKYEESLKQKTKPYFLWKLEFAKVFKDKGGFDIVVGNPPYVGQKGNNNDFVAVKNTQFGNKFHQRRMDFFYFFFHKGLDLVKDNGTLAYITTNYFLTATYADKLRADFKQRTSLLGIINFNELKIFETALGQHNAITFLKKKYSPKHIAKFISAEGKGFCDSKTLKSIFEGNFKSATYSTKSNENIYEGDLNYIRFKMNQNSNEDILSKMIDGNQTMSSYVQLVEGIHTGADTVSNSHIEKYNISEKKGSGIFVLSQDEYNAVNWTDEELSMIKPWYKNSDINKWNVKKSENKYLIYFNSKKEYTDIENVKKHLLKYKVILINRKVRSGTGIITVEDYEDFINGNKYISYVMNASAFKSGNFYAISYPREESVFTGEKIICPQRCYSNKFAYHEGELYASADVYFIKQMNSSIKMKYLLGLLNSKLYYYWLINKGKLKGKMLELYIQPLSEIPIKIADDIIQEKISNLVEIILQKRTSEPFFDASTIEVQIDQLVYQIYGLTEEEIRIVEGI
jgi:adenine-specific DNA-methyltransferase